MLPGLEQGLNKQVLKMCVGSAIFCPACQNILDVRRAVNVDVNKGDRVVLSKCVCIACWDATKDEVTAKATELGCTLELLDGRELYGKKKPEDKIAEAPTPVNKIKWRGEFYDIPDDEQIEEWVFDSVCESPDGEIVEPDHPDSWLSLMGLI